MCPLPLGSIYQWSWAGLGVLVGVLLLISLAFEAVKPGDLSHVLARLWLPASLYLLATLWVGLQASGMTPAILHHPIWQQTAEILATPVSGHISLNPYDTWSEMLKMLTYGGIFWLAASHAAVPGRARATLWVIGAVGALYATYGLVAYLTNLGDHLWFRDVIRYQGVTSTFFSRNMYGVYAALGFLSVACLLLNTWIARSRTPAEGLRSWLAFVTGPQNKALPLVTLALVLLMALVMTGSRGTIFAMAAAGAVLFLCIGRRFGESQSLRRSIMRFAVIIVFFAGVSFLLAGAHLGSRLTELHPGTGRIAGYQILLTAIAEAPLTGYGGASARDVFYLHNQGSLWKTFNYSHNLYLGAAVEMGIPAATAMIAAVALVAGSCLKGIWRRRRDQIFPALGVGTTVLVAVHGLVDAPLLVPANAATYSLLLGVAYAQSWPTREASVPSMPAAPQGRAAEGPLASVEAQHE